MKVQVYVKKSLDINSLWSVKFYDYESYHIIREEVYDEKKSCSLKIRVFEVLWCFKDKESDEQVLVFCKNKASDESTSLY